MLNIIINHSSMIPIYEQIVSHVKACIVSGELSEGDVLPSVRALAAQLEISALTVKKAYDRLEEEGVLVTVHGKGSFVSGCNTGMIAESRRKDAEDALAAAIVRARAAGYSSEEIKELIGLIMNEER